MCSAEVISTAWSPDGSLLVSGDYHGVMKAWTPEVEAWTPEVESVRDFVGHS